MAVTYLSEQQVKGHLLVMSRLSDVAEKWESVGIKSGLWSSLEASFGDASHYIFVFVLMSPSCPRSSSRRIRATFCLCDTIEPFLPWYFHNVFLQSPVHTHILCRRHRTLIQSRSGRALYPIFHFLWKVFAQLWFEVDSALKKKVRSVGSMIDISHGSVTEKPCKSLYYSMVVWHGLTSEDWRNVSGSTGRIPQSCATRSLHWQESATYFRMRTATLRLCLIALLCLFLILPAYLSLAPLFLSLSIPPCLAPSLSFSLSLLSIAFHHFIFCSSCSPFVCLCFSRVSLLVNLSVCLSVTPSILLSYFASYFFLTIPSVFYLSPCTFCWCFSSSNIHAFRYLYSKRHYSVIAVWFIHSPALHPPIFFCIKSVSPPPVSRFICGTLSSVLQVLSRGHVGSAGEWDKRRCRDLHSLCDRKYHTGMLVINAVL